MMISQKHSPKINGERNLKITCLKKKHPLPNLHFWLPAVHFQLCTASSSPNPHRGQCGAILELSAQGLANGSVLTSDIVVDIQVMKQGLLHY